MLLFIDKFTYSYIQTRSYSFRIIRPKIRYEPVSFVSTVNCPLLKDAPMSSLWKAWIISCTISLWRIPRTMAAIFKPLIPLSDSYFSCNPNLLHHEASFMLPPIPHLSNKRITRAFLQIFIPRDKLLSRVAGIPEKTSAEIVICVKRKYDYHTVTEWNKTIITSLISLESNSLSLSKDD